MATIAPTTNTASPTMSLQQGAAYGGSTVQYDTATGAKLAPGQSTNVSSNLTPSVGNNASQSTTTLSTQNAAAKVPGIQQTTTNLANQTGSTASQDVNGNVVASNGKTLGYANNLPPDDPSNQYNTATGQPKDANGNPLPLTTLSTTDQSIMDQLNQRIVSTDAQTASIIQNIQGQYAGLIQQQQRVNAAANAGITTAMSMGGATGTGSAGQYAPIAANGEIQSQITFGINAIAELQTKMNAAVNQAQIAGQNADWAIQDQQNKIAQDAQTTMQQAAQHLSDQVAAAAKDAADQAFTARQDALNRQLQEQSILQTAQKNSADEANAKASLNLEAIKTDIAEKTYNATYGAFMGADGSMANSNPTAIPGYTQLPNGTSIINSANLPDVINKKSNIGGIPVLDPTQVQVVKNISNLSATAAQLQVQFNQLNNNSDPNPQEVAQYQTAANAFNDQLSKMSSTADDSNLTNLHIPTDIWGGAGRQIANIFQGTPDSQFSSVLSQLNKNLTSIIPGYSAPPYGTIFATPQDAQQYFASSGLNNEYTSEVAKANALAQQAFGRNANDGEIMQIINGQ